MKRLADVILDLPAQVGGSGVKAAGACDHPVAAEKGHETGLLEIRGPLGSISFRSESETGQKDRSGKAQQFFLSAAIRPEVHHGRPACCFMGVA